jgi:hypothetical protein
MRNKPDKRRPNLHVEATIAALTFALVWCLTQGEPVGAVIAGVLWTFYVVFELAWLALWLRQRSTSGSKDLPPSH